MNKIIIAFVTLFVVCTVNANEYPSLFGNMRTPCVNKVLDQIGCEVRASLEYLKFGAHFSHDSVNRPGFAKFFFDSSSEEREHAIKLIEYLNMRGAHHPGQVSPVTGNLKEYEALLKHASDCKIFDEVLPECKNIETGKHGMECALKMEIAVTSHINSLIRQCEKEKDEVGNTCNAGQKGLMNQNCNDYHFVDYLTGEFLEEQYDGQRKIAGYMKTLEKMQKTHGNIGEFFFDKTLLE